MAQVVADSSSLVGLERIDRLDLLGQLLGEVLVPGAVAREVKKKLPELPPWITVRDVTRPLPPEVVGRRLGSGESETIALAFELKIRQDSADARRRQFIHAWRRSMLYCGYVIEFRSNRSPGQLEKVINDSGPYVWQAFEGDQEGVYLTCQPDAFSDIKLSGRASQLEMTLEFLCEEAGQAAAFEASKVRVLATVRERVLPAAGAEEVRESGPGA